MIVKEILKTVERIIMILSNIFTQEKSEKIVEIFEKFYGFHNITEEKLYNFAFRMKDEETFEKYKLISKIDSDAIAFGKLDAYLTHSINDLQEIIKLKVEDTFSRYYEFIHNIDSFISFAKENDLENIPPVENYFWDYIDHPFDHDGAFVWLYKQAKETIIKHHKRLPRKQTAQRLFGVAIYFFGEGFAQIPIKYIINGIKNNDDFFENIENYRYIAIEIVRDYLEVLGIETIMEWDGPEGEVFDEDNIEFLAENLEAVLALKTSNKDKIWFYHKYVFINKQVLINTINSSLFDRVKKLKEKAVSRLLKDAENGIKITPQRIKEVELEMLQEKIRKEVEKTEKVLGFKLKETKEHVFSTVVSHGHYDVRVLQHKDTTQVMLGEYTHCCQHAGGVGESCMIAGIKEKQSGFLVWEKDGKVKAQAWIWVDKNGGLVLDNIETADFVKKEFVLTSLEVWAEDNKNFKNIQIGTGYSDADLEGYEVVSVEETFGPDFAYSGYTDSEDRVWFKKGGVICKKGPERVSEGSEQSQQWGIEDPFEGADEDYIYE
jgi:hypothetical protein